MSSPSGLLACLFSFPTSDADIGLNASKDRKWSITTIGLYLTGAGTTMSRLGMPDLGVATLNDMRDHAAMIASLDRSVPLIADMDTGYGGPLMVGRAVEQYVQAGVAGFHIEDQITTKRCGHLKNKELATETEWYARIRAAVNARAKTGRDIVIIARTDALQSLGYDAAVERLKGALALGADVAFLEGIESKEQARHVCIELSPYPVLLNMVQGGVTPYLSVPEAQEHGFKLVIYPALALAPVYTSVSEAYEQLRQTGDVEHDVKLTPKEIFSVCGLKEAVEFDVAAGGALYKNGV
ncbi:putative carboxyphosphonoenolpyruvate mutase [Coniochaeta sp. 2T2.1]|nr:putative carboxyphosphonoenolpyruvate mutase [Coniochaeta sp. 2T2.1]